MIQNKMIPAKREEMVWIIQLLNGLVEWSFWNSTRLCTIAVKNIAESRIKKDKLILQVVRIFANRTVQYKFLLVDIWEYPDLEYLCLHWSKIMLLLESEMRSSNMFCPSLVHISQGFFKLKPYLFYFIWPKSDHCIGNACH